MSVEQTVPEAAAQLEDFIDNFEDLETPGVDEPEVVEDEEVEVEVEEETEVDDTEDEDSDEDEAEEEPEADPEDALFDIEIDGEEYEVNLPELKEGYLRSEELARRTTELETEYQEKISSVEAREAALAAELESLVLTQSVELQRYRNVDWEALKRDDPEQYRNLRIQAIDAQEQVQKLSQRRADIQRLHNQAQAIRQEAYLKDQREIAKRLIPDFEKPEFQQSVLQYGKQIGYTEEEIQGISDARQLLILNQARLFAESQVRRKAALEKKESKDLPPAIKPGAPKTKTQEEGRKSKHLRSKLNQTHDLRDAAAVLLDYV